MVAPSSMSRTGPLLTPLVEETPTSFGVPGEVYVINDMIGEGSFGSVYRCELSQSELPRPNLPTYAVKVIHSQRLAIACSLPLELIVPRLCREVEILQHLGSHPRVLKLLRAFFSTKTSRFYLVTEELKGGDLFQAILRRRRHFSEVEARQVFSQIVEAVAFCHSKGVAHRDLKLENVLLEDRDALNVKLCDYGQAKVLCGADFTDTARTLTTTPTYTAPEVATAVQTARPYNAFKADSFGLGVILYGLLCSALPDAAHKKSFERHKRWSSLSNAVRDLIQRLLAPDPDERCAVEDVCHHPWIRGSPPSPGSPPPLAEADRSSSWAPSSSTPTPIQKMQVEVLLSAQQVVIALQKERGTCCWAISSEEGEAEYSWHCQYTTDKMDASLGVLGRLTSAAHPLQAAWVELENAFTSYRAQVVTMREQLRRGALDRNVRLDVEEDFAEAFGLYSELLNRVIKSVEGAVVAVGLRLQGRSTADPPSQTELQHRLLQMCAEQLGRERAFICGHLGRPESLRLSSVLLTLASIIGARKVLIGTTEASSQLGEVFGTLVPLTIVESRGGLSAALRLSADGPLEDADLASLEAAEQRLLTAKKSSEALAVSECWYLLTKCIDKVHQHIMVGIVDAFTHDPARP